MTREPTEMELRVAEAAYRALFIVDEDLGCAIGGRYWELCLKAAGSAIRAMREPTAEMLAAFSNTGRSYAEDGPDMPDAWQAMIDAASPPVE